MTEFIHDNFLLTNATAELLYHDYARHLPIIDYHNHLNPADIAADRIFGSIGSLWLEGDHYKWRALRACGIDEKYITGISSDWEKFEKWAIVMPLLIRSPLYHWSHLELKRYFGVNQILNPATARAVYEQCNSVAPTKAFSVRNLLRKVNLEYSCSMEDPCETLGWHAGLKKDFEITVAAAFRPDRVLNIGDGSAFRNYIARLEEASDVSITSYSQLCDALESRHNFFHGMGCNQADFALDWIIFDERPDPVVNGILEKVLDGGEVSRADANIFRTAVLVFLCSLNHQKGWVQQFHLGALRSINDTMVKRIGEATGFDCINDGGYIEELGKLLNRLEDRGVLTKSIFFNLNPAHNTALVALINSFNDGIVHGKMQFGPPWWFLDHREGIEQQLNALSSIGVFGNFIGMLTDSRSFLSFTRHEYFRRILCNLLGSEAESGLIPDDRALLVNIVENICYYNAKKFLSI